MNKDLKLGDKILIEVSFPEHNQKIYTITTLENINNEDEFILVNDDDKIFMNSVKSVNKILDVLDNMLLRGNSCWFTSYKIIKEGDNVRNNSKLG